METEIDPLSMLEQTMQVNDYSVTSNGDQEVVMVCDDEPETVSPTPLIEVPDEESLVMVHDGMPVSCELPAMVVPDSYADHEETTPTTVLVDPSQLIQQGIVEQDISMGFGEHFLASPGPSFSCVDGVSPLPSDSQPNLTMNRVVNGRARGGKTRGTPRSRRGSKATSTLSRWRPINPPLSKPNLMKLAIMNNKVVNNAKKLSFASSYEQSYRQKVFANLEKVLNSRLDCTVCGSHIGCHIDVNVFLVTHPLLKVLMCTKCRENYCQVDWSLGTEFQDSRCRWCSKVPSHRELLKSCIDCPFSFCESCIGRNFSKKDKATIMHKQSWSCFACQLIPLYFMRATCWALSMFISTLPKRRSREAERDMAKCCKGGLVSSVGAEVVVKDEDPVQGTAPVFNVSCYPVTTTINQLFSGIDSVRNTLQTKIKKKIDVQNVDTFVYDVNLSLGKIGRNIETCLQFMKNWRVQTMKDYMQKDFVRVNPEKRADPEKIVCPKKESIQGPAGNRIRRVNGTHDYSYLFKKYNIKPCQVVLERLDEFSVRQETSQPPNFFLSLVPECSQPSVNEISSDDDDSSSIICLDD